MLSLIHASCFGETREICFIRDTCDMMMLMMTMNIMIMMQNFLGAERYKLLFKYPWPSYFFLNKLRRRAPGTRKATERVTERVGLLIFLLHTSHPFSTGLKVEFQDMNGYRIL
jgi:hypothetical protein